MAATPVAYVLYDAPWTIKLMLLAAISLVVIAAVSNGRYQSDDRYELAGHWQYASESNDVWYSMSPAVTRILDQLAREPRTPHTVRIGAWDYQIDFDAATQRNVQTDKRRKIRRI